MLLLLGLACDFSASTSIVGLDTGADTGTDTDTDAGDTDPGGDTDTAPDDSGDPDPYAVDDDGDGASEYDGDCDDEDATIHPGATDVCNTEDDDCDGDIDEDAAPDAYEPNDDVAVDIGDLAEDPERSVVATLSGEADVDRYRFTLTDDTFDFFTVTMTLSGIPDDATWRFTLNRLASDGDLALGEVDRVFGTDSLELTLDDVSLQDDGGTYELVVESIAGADCGRTYLLAVQK
jgi:hypothetical protein